MWFKLPLLALVVIASASPNSLYKRQNTDEFIDQMVASHNFFRSQHGAEPLSYDGELAQKAQRWADTCNFYHEGGAGENLAYMNPFHSWASFVNMWGSERKQHNFNSPGFSPATGHFTQVVWKKTTDVGCGWKLCHGGPRKANGYYVVCKYSPAGNYQGQFRENVGRQIHGSPNDTYESSEVPDQ